MGLSDLYAQVQESMELYLDESGRDYECYEEETDTYTFYTEIDAETEMGARAVKWKDYVMANGYEQYFSDRSLSELGCIFLYINLKEDTYEVDFDLYTDEFYLDGDDEIYDGLTQEEIYEKICVLRACRNRKLVKSFIDYVLRDEDMNF